MLQDDSRLSFKEFIHLFVPSHRGNIGTIVLDLMLDILFEAMERPKSRTGYKSFKRKFSQDSWDMECVLEPPERVMEVVELPKPRNVLYVLKRQAEKQGQEIFTQALTLALDQCPGKHSPKAFKAIKYYSM